MSWDLRAAGAAVCMGVLLAAGAAAAGEAQRGRLIAVLPLKNLRTDAESDWIGVGAGETLTTKLVGVPGLVAVERSQVKKVVEEQKFQSMAITDPETAVKVGKLLGAERIVIGTFAPHEGHVMFNVRVVDVQTGAILSTASVTGKLEGKGLFEAFYKLAEAVVESFDKTVVILESKPVVQDAPAEQRIQLTEEQRQLLRQAGTASTEAFKANTKGISAGAAGGGVGWFSEAIRLDPKYARAYSNRGVAYFNQGDYARAIQDYTAAIRLAPHMYIPYSNRGNAYFTIGQHDLAIADCSKAIALKPSAPTPYYNRGNPWVAKGDLNRAVADYTTAIRLKPDFAMAYSNRGVVYHRAAQYDHAIRDLSRAIQLNRNVAAMYYNRANAYGKKEWHPQAIQDYTRSLQFSPNHAPSYHNRAMSYLKLRAYAQAWNDAKACERLGGRVHPQLIQALVRVTGRRW